MRQCTLKIDTDVFLYKEQVGLTKFVGSARIYVAGVVDLDELKRCAHGVVLNRWFGSDLIIMKAAVIHKNSFPVLYPFD